jgi:tRNA threonylcarbamoyl adenosine modification protein YeaZ
MRSILGIDTASPRGSIALLVDGIARAVAELPPGGHSSGLAVDSERIAREAGLTLAALSGVAVSRGPGSFTGLRIGLAWAKGIAVGAGTPLALVSAHEAAAVAAAAAGDAEGWLVSVTPGERREAEIALWERNSANPALPRLLREPQSIPEHDLAEAIAALTDGRRYVALPSNDALAALLEEDDLPRRAPTILAPAVAAVGDRLLREGSSSDVVLATPAYGREPNARKPAP